jgi:TolB-like protein
MVEEIIRRCHASAGCSSSLGIRVSLTKGQAVDVKRVARELGVRYVLEGSVRKSGNRVRITAQACYAHMRRLDEARAIIRQLRK